MKTTEHRDGLETAFENWETYHKKQTVKSERDDRKYHQKLRQLHTDMAHYAHIFHKHALRGLSIGAEGIINQMPLEIKLTFKQAQDKLGMGVAMNFVVDIESKDNHVDLILGLEASDKIVQSVMLTSKADVANLRSSPDELFRPGQTTELGVTNAVGRDDVVLSNAQQFFDVVRGKTIQALKTHVAEVYA